MFWVIAGAILAAVALAAVGYCALVVFRSVKGLFKALTAARDRLGDAAAPVLSALDGLGEHRP